MARGDILKAIGEDEEVDLFEKKISLLISQQTYSIYLFHLIIIYVFIKIKLSIYIATPTYIFLLFFISSLIYNLFEKPLLKLRPKIS